MEKATIFHLSFDCGSFRAFAERKMIAFSTPFILSGDSVRAEAGGPNGVVQATYLTPKSSTSKTSVALGGIVPGTPVAP